MKVNGKYYYYAGDILKVWDCHLQESKLCFYLNINGKEEILKSLFADRERLTPSRLAGIVINNNDKKKSEGNNFALQLFKHESGEHSISLCDAVEPQEEMTSLEQAIEQINQWQVSQNIKIQNHHIIFPYHQGPSHWNLGVLKLEFSNAGLIKAALEVYEPLYEGVRLSPIFIAKTKACLKYKTLEAKVIYTRQQRDSTSCGPISAENGRSFLMGEVREKLLLLEKRYPCNAEELRKSHIDLINSETFKQVQEDEQAFYAQIEAKNQAEDSNNIWIIYKKLITFFEAQEAKIKGELSILCREHSGLKIYDDESQRAIYHQWKKFLTLYLSDPELLKKIIKEDKWQENAVDVLELLAKKQPQINPPKKRADDECPYNNRSSIKKAFPGPLYQCLVALHHMLLMLKQGDDFDIRMEDADAGAFDDIIIQHKGRTEYLQIKHKYNQEAVLEYAKGIFKAGNKDPLTFDKYFDDWYLFIKNAKDAGYKEYTFHTTAKPTNKVKEFFNFDDKTGAYTFKKMERSIRVGGDPSKERINDDDILVYFWKNAWGFKYDNQLYDIGKAINQLTQTTIQQLHNARSTGALLSDKAKEEILFLAWRSLQMKAFIDDIEKNSLLINNDRYKKEVANYCEAKVLKSEDEKGGNNPTVGKLRDLYKRNQLKQVFTPAEANENLNEFLTTFRLKFSQEHINVLEQTVRSQVFEYIGEQVSGDNVYHALILQVQSWFRDMQANRWNQDTVRSHLDVFKKRYINFVHHIGEAQLAFRQINNLFLYSVTRLFNNTFNIPFDVKVKNLLKQESGSLLLLSPETPEVGSILIEQYLQSAHNQLVFGDYIYFDSRYMEATSFDVIEEVELKLVVLDRVDEYMKRDPGGLFDHINQVLQKHKKLILVCSEETSDKLRIDFLGITNIDEPANLPNTKDKNKSKAIQKSSATKLDCFVYKSPDLTKDQALEAIEQLGGNTTVCVGNKQFNIRDMNWNEESSFTKLFSQLPLLVQASMSINQTTDLQADNKEKIVPLVLEELVPLYDFRTIVECGKVCAILLPADKSSEEVQQTLNQFRIFKITAEQLDNANYLGTIGGLIAQQATDKLECFKNYSLVIVIDCTHGDISYEQLQKLDYRRIIILTNRLNVLDFPVFKLAKENSSLLELCYWHSWQEGIEPAQRVKRNHGENLEELVTYAANDGHVVICADPGAGKSTMAKELYTIWCHESLKIPSYWLVHVELGQLKAVDGKKELLDLLLDRYNISDKASWQAKLLANELGKNKIIFILDGWDEVQHYQKVWLLQAEQGGNEKLLDKLVAYKHVIWTTRPSEVTRIPCIVKRQFDLQRFTPAKIKQFFDKRFSASPDFSEQAFKYITQAGHHTTVEMVGLPLQCHLLCETWLPYYHLFLRNEKIKLPWQDNAKLSMITIYQQFVKARLWRYLASITKVADDQTVAYFELQQRVYLFCGEHLKRLQLFAYGALFNQKKSHYYERLLDDDLQKVAVTFSPQLQDANLAHENKTIDIYFEHKTYAEYLAAIYFANQLTKDNVRQEITEKILRHRYHPDYLIVWQFLAAIISSGDPAVINAARATDDFWHLMLEQQPRDFIGVVERDLLQGCLKSGSFNYNNLVKKFPALGGLDRYSSDDVEMSNADGSKEETVSQDESKIVYLQKKEVFVKPNMPIPYRDRASTLHEVALNKYAPAARVDYLHWLRLLYSEQANVRVVASIIPNIVGNLCSNSDTSEHGFFTSPCLLPIVFSIIGSSNQESWLQFITEIDPSQEQLKQMLDFIDNENASNKLIESILICFIRLKKDAVTPADVNQWLLESNDSEVLRKIACYFALRQHQYVDDSLLITLALALLVRNFNHIPIVLFILQQVNSIFDINRMEIVKKVYEWCFQAIENRRNSRNFELTKAQVKETLLLLDHLSAIDETMLAAVFHESQDYDYWDLNVVIPAVKEFKNTSSVEIHRYFFAKHNGKYNWKIALPHVFESSLKLLGQENISEANQLIIMKDLLSIYKDEDFGCFRSLEPVKSLTICFKIYSTVDSGPQLTIAKFILDICTYFKIALCANGGSNLTLGFGKESHNIHFVHAEQLKATILEIRSQKAPDDELVILWNKPIILINHKRSSNDINELDSEEKVDSDYSSPSKIARKDKAPRQHGMFGNNSRGENIELSEVDAQQVSLPS
jgi:hypothetical protein